MLVTGTAGFIGAALVERLLSTESGLVLVGLDNLNDYYDLSLKEYRLASIKKLAVTAMTEEGGECSILCMPHPQASMEATRRFRTRLFSRFYK